MKSLMCRGFKFYFFLLTVSCYLLTVLTGCGYTTRSMISNEYRTIFVSAFINKIDITRDQESGNKYKIYRPMLETDITKAVNDKYLFDGNLKPVKKESADLVLEGELVDFRRDALRYTDNDEVYEYRINILVNLKLQDKKADKLLWQENNFTGNYTYFAQGPYAKSEASAVNDAIKDLAHRVVERTVEQW